MRLTASTIFAVAALAAAFPPSAAAVPPRLELFGRIHEDGAVVERPVAPGAVLRSGDEVRLLVTGWEDGYLYVVSLGSSGSAVVLHPLSGNDFDARTRAGETVAVPRDGGYVPLDARTGRESLFAFTTPEPMASLSSLLVRIEALAADRPSARAALEAQGLKPAYLSFGHAPGDARRATPDTPPAAATASAGDAPPAEKPDPVPRTSGVLGGLGSRIATFRSDPPAQPAQPSGAGREQVASGSDRDDSRAPRPAGGDGSREEGGLLSGLAGLFGIGGSDATASRSDRAPGETAVAASTFALEPSPGPAAPAPLPPPPGAREASAPRPTGRPLPPSPADATIRIDREQPLAAPDAPSAPARPQPGGRVEGTLARDLAQAPSPPTPPAPARVEMPVRADAGTAARPARSAAAQEVPIAAVPIRPDVPITVEALPRPAASPVAGPAAAQSGSPGKPRDEETASGVLASAFGGAPPERPGSGVPELPVAEAQAPASDRVSAPETAKPAPDANAVLSAQGSLLPPPSGQRAGEAAVAAAREEPGPAAAPLSPSADADAGASDSGVNPFGILGALFGGGSKDDGTTAVAPAGEDSPAPERVSAVAAEPAPASPAAIGSAEEGSGPESTEVAETEQADRPPSESGSGEGSPAASGSGGFFSRLFGGTPTPEAPAAPDEIVDESPSKASAPPILTEPSESVPGTSPAKDVATADVEPRGESTGLLAGLSAFFGGGDEPAASRAPEVPPEEAAAQPAPERRVNTGPEPTLSQRVDESGRRVVRLEGAPPPRERSSEVLSESGSRIRALLNEPEPEPARGELPPAPGSPPPPSVTPAPTMPAAAPARIAAAPTAVTPRPERAPAETLAAVTPRPERAPAETLAAVTPRPEGTSAETSAAVPSRPERASAETSAAVTPDPVQRALEGGRVAPPSDNAATLAMLTTAPPRAVAQAAEGLAQVDLLDPAGPAAAVVLVVTPDGASSGVVLDSDGHLLTNWHSVRGYDTVVVFFKAKGGTGPARTTRVRARVLGHSKFSDLALLRAEAAPPADALPAIVAKVQLDSGEPMHAIGHGSSPNWQHIVVVVDRVRPNSSWYSLERVLHRGDVIRATLPQVTDLAGAPLFNNQMELVGLAAMVRGDKQELIGVSADTIRTFLGPPQ